MIIKLHNLSKNLTFGAVILYFAQGALFANDSVVSKLALLIILLLSVYYICKLVVWKIDKNLLFYMWLIFLTINSFYYVVGGNYDDIYYSQYRNILSAIMPFFIFYYLSLKKYLVNKDFLIFFLCLLPLSILNFYVSKNYLIEEMDINEDVVVNNAAYFFVALIPFIFLWGKRKITAVLMLLISLFFIIQSAKRGALIAGVLASIVFIFYQFFNPGTLKKSTNLIISSFLIVALLIASYNFYITNEYLISRLQNVEGTSSGRDVIYSHLWNHWYGSNNFINYLFGFGFVSTIKYSGEGKLAHNDWLEVLTNFGLLGVVVYALAMFSLIIFIYKNKSNKELQFTAMAVLVIWILETLFSMYYTNSNTMLASILLGYLMGKSRQENLKNYSLTTFIRKS